VKNIPSFDWSGQSFYGKESEFLSGGKQAQQDDENEEGNDLIQTSISEDSLAEMSKAFRVKNIPSFDWSGQSFYGKESEFLSGGKQAQQDDVIQTSISEDSDDATVEKYLHYISPSRLGNKYKRSTSIISVDLSEDMVLEDLEEQIPPRQSSRLGGGFLIAAFFLLTSAALTFFLLAPASFITWKLPAQVDGNGQGENNLDHNETLPEPMIISVNAHVGGNGQGENNLDHNETLPGTITGKVPAQVDENGQGGNNLDHNGTLPGPITTTLPAQVGENGQGENNLDHNGTLPGPCRDMEIAYNTAVHGMLGSDTKTIKEYICNAIQRQEIVGFITNLDASTMDDCEAMIYGPLVAIKFNILERLTDEDTCRAELEEELSMFPQGLKLSDVLQSGQHKELLDLITVAALNDAASTATTSVENTYHGCEETLDDGVTCVFGTSCNCCENEATYWYGKTATACGEEPCWGKDIYCFAGTSCNNCCSSWKWYGPGAYCL